MPNDQRDRTTARLKLVDGAPLLRPAEQVFDAVLDGWRNQQLARNLAVGTVEGRRATVRAFAAAANAFPWQWSPQMLDEWLGDLRSVRHVKRTTIRSYQDAVRSFCQYATDPAYGWAAECEARFGSHPIQVVHEWNTAVHVQENEADAAKRAFTRRELHTLFAYCDDQVARIRGLGRKGDATATVGYGNVVAAQMPYRNSAQYGRDTTATYLFAVKIPLTAGKTVQALTLPSTTGGTLHVFAIATG